MMIVVKLYEKIVYIYFFPISFDLTTILFVSEQKTN